MTVTLALFLYESDDGKYLDQNLQWEDTATAYTVTCNDDEGTANNIQSFCTIQFGEQYLAISGPEDNLELSFVDSATCDNMSSCTNSNDCAVSNPGCWYINTNYTEDIPQGYGSLSVSYLPSTSGTSTPTQSSTPSQYILCYNARSGPGNPATQLITNPNSKKITYFCNHYLTNMEASLIDWNSNGS